MNHRILGLGGLALFVTACGMGTSGESVSSTHSQALTLTGTAFFTPDPNKDGKHQVAELTAAGNKADARLLSSMLEQPQAVWLTKGTPKQVLQQARQIASEATGKGKVPVFVAYNVPFRDCAQFSAGGALTQADYQAWIDGVVAGIGDRKAVVLLEPDGLGIIPHTKTIFGGSEWCQPAEADAETASDERYALLNYAVDALKSLPNTKVYLDGTHSGWLGVPEAASRLERAGVRRADGFFLNVSNYRPTDESITYGRLVSKALAVAASAPAWAYDEVTGNFHYDWLPGQYVEVAPGDWQPVYTAENVASVTAAYEGFSSAAATVPFVIDTSRNGQGAWTTTDAPAGSDPQVWCNPPARGLGFAPTANTGEALVDAYLWVKIPGESDGECNRWAPLGSPDPVRGVIDPAAGGWFADMALELVHNANPAL